MPPDSFPIIEVFGPTLQGEGALAGQPTQFVRFGLCDFRCSWCDSGHAVIPENVKANAEQLDSDAIISKVAELGSNARWVTLSGGNPAMYELGDLVLKLRAAGYKVAVETQGTIYRTWLSKVQQLTVSPKPPSSGMARKNNLREFLAKAEQMPYPRYLIALKVVVFDDEDLTFARETHLEYPGYPFYLSVGTRMGGLYGDFAGGQVDTRDDILDRYRWLAERVAADKAFRDAAAFPQLHALIWGHGQGH